MSLNIPQTTIAFQGGAYGHYMHWVLYSLLYPAPLMSPFKKSTSHSRSYIDTALVEAGTCLIRHSSMNELTDPKLKLSTIHPVTADGGFDQDFIQNLKSISDQVDRVIVPYCDHATYLLGVHNYIFKIWNNIWTGPLRYVDKQDLKQGWGIEVDDMTKIPNWILREHHSMNVFNSWESQCGWFAPDYFQQTNAKFVFVHDLLYNFLHTVEQIKQFLNVEWIRDPAELLPLHKQNIHNQKYKNQDLIAQHILNSIVDGTDYTWLSTDITLYTEAYIQRRLQQLGIMLKCNELNNFPTSTKQLLEVCE